MNYKKVFFAIATLVCVLQPAFSQSDTSRLLTLVSKLDTLSNSRPVEKVYLQLDKPYYFLGDTLRFKAYVTVTGQHRLSALSGVLYADLVDPDAKVIRAIKLHVINGTAVGDLALADSLPEGKYRVRAYTNWMRNSAPEYYFDQAINVINAHSAKVLMQVAYKNSTDNNATTQHIQLTYTDNFGRPLTNKQVKYEMKAGAKGAGVTDLNGHLEIVSQPINGTKGPAELITHISLFGSVSVTKTAQITRATDNDIQFFAESGHQVTGLRSKIAFKAIRPDGIGIDAKGTIIDNDNNEVAYFSTAHLGMGVFAMTQQSGKTYRAKVTYADGTVNTVPLPPAVSSGFILAVDNTDPATITVRVTANAALFDEKKNSTFYVLGQSGGKSYFTTMGRLDNPSFSIPVPKNRFPSGIAQFTLFSSSGEPLCERVAFIQNNDQLKLDIKTDKATFSPRGEVKMDITVLAPDNTPSQGSFSASVIDEGRIPANLDAESTIFSYLLLTSDLKGYIEQPGYYFENATDKTRADLDVLMLTQGYRRFEWKEIVAGRYPIMGFAPEQTLSLSGTITLPSGKPVVNGSVRVLATKSNMIVDTVTNAQGKFIFPDLDLPDSTKITIVARKANEGKNVDIRINNIPSPKVIADKVPQNVSGDIFARFIADTAQVNGSPKPDPSAAIPNVDTLKYNLLKQVNVRSSKTPKPTIYNNYGTYLQYDLKMDKAQYQNSVFEALKWNVPGVKFIGDGKLYYLFTKYDHMYKASENLISQAVINGVQVDITDMEVVDPKDVESISLIMGKPPTVMVTTKASAGTDIVKLKDVNIRSVRSKRPQASPNSANLNGPGNADQVITAKEMENNSRLVDYLSTHVMGITYNADNGEFRMTRSPSFHPQAMVIILDGAVVSGDAISPLSTTDVASVEVLKSVAYLSMYGSNAPGGAFVITTKRGADEDGSYTFKSVPGVVYQNFAGFYQAKQFYAPKYTPLNIGSQIPDLRTTIYWAPYIITNKEGKASLSFFNADSKGTYKAVIEGVDVNGHIGRFVYRYKVE